MNILSPWNLLWIPPIAGAIIALYILKLRRKDVIVSSTFLWQQVIRDVQANAPFQKLRYSPLLLLQLLAALLLILALARPVWRFFTMGGRTTVMVVDTGASMQAKDGSPTRLDSARQEADRLINSMRPGDSMLILSASYRPQTLTGFTSDQRELQQAVSNLKPHDTPTDMGASLRLAGQLASSERGNNGRIELISDGCFTRTAITEYDPGKVQILFHLVGKSADNVGIVAADCRRAPGRTGGLEALTVLHNYSNQPHSFVETLSADDNLIDARDVSLPADGEETEAFSLPEPSVPVRLHAQIKLQDQLSVDNDAYLIATPRKQIKALVVGSPDFFLQNALMVDPGVHIDQVPEYPGPEAAKPYDVVVFYHTLRLPSHLPEGHYLFIHCIADKCPAHISGAGNGVGVVDWERQDPIMNYVDISSLHFDSAYAAEPYSWAHEVVTGDTGALIADGEKNRTRSIFFAFDPDLSRLPLAVAFPILVSNSIHWLANGDQGELAMENGYTGAARSIPAPVGSGPLKITAPDGKSAAADVGIQGGAAFDRTSETGFYTVRGNGYQTVFAANLADAASSNIAPVKALAFLPGEKSTPAGHRVLAAQLFLEPLVLLAIALLSLEWFLFHRRPYMR